MNVRIKLSQNMNGLIKAEFEEGVQLQENEGFGNTISEAIKDLAFRLDQSVLDGEEEKFKHFLEDKFPVAKELCKGLFDVVGNDWFTIPKLSNRLDEHKDIILLKINFLNKFGFIEKDRPTGAGARYRIIQSEEDRREYYQDKIKQHEKAIQRLNAELIQHEEAIKKAEEVTQLPQEESK